MGIMTRALESTCRATRHSKELAARLGERYLPLMVQGYRGDRLFILAQLDDVNGSDDVLRLSAAVGQGFEVDVLAVASETWAATDRMKNPVTGKPWAAGEMQDVVDNHQGLERGWVVDAMMIQVANRAGDIAMATMQYRPVGRRVEWLEELRFTDADGEVGGAMTDALRSVMLAKTISLTMPEVSVNSASEQFSLSQEQVIAHRDCALAKLMSEPPANWVRAGFPSGVQVALGAEPGSVRQGIIKRSMPHSRWLSWDRNN